MKYVRTDIALMIGCSICLFPLTSLATTQNQWFAISGDMGLGGLHGSACSTFQSGLDLREGNLALGIYGRLRLLLSSRDNGSSIYRRDWDEASDFVHILRQLEYRRRFSSAHLSARVGEISGYTLGHGTLIHDYSNLADPDHLHSGFNFSLEGTNWFAQAMIDSFFRPHAVAARFELSPFNGLKGLRFGSSVVLDPTAPQQILMDGRGRRWVDEANNLQSEPSVLGLWGADISYTFGTRGERELTTYFDGNTSFHGAGLHVGVWTGVPLDDNERIRFNFHAEYSRSSAGYSPAYIETFYDIERFQPTLSFVPTGSETSLDSDTKLSLLQNGNYGGHGYLFQAGVEFRRYLHLKIGHARRSGPESLTLFSRIATSPLKELSFGTMLMIRGIGSDNSLLRGTSILGEAHWGITSNLYLLGQYARTWSLSSSTYFEIAQVFTFSLGANWAQ